MAKEARSRPMAATTSSISYHLTDDDEGSGVAREAAVAGGRSNRDESDSEGLASEGEEEGAQDLTLIAQ